MLLGEGLLARVEIPFCFACRLSLTVGFIWDLELLLDWRGNQIRPGLTSTRICILHTCHSTRKKIQEQVSMTM
jgi:hypothetical protein